MQSLTPDEERRGSKRYHLYDTIKMQFGADRRQRECIILNISDEGVRVYAVGFDVPDEFVLLFSDVVRERYKVIWLAPVRLEPSPGAIGVESKVPKENIASTGMASKV